ncbi:MAG TPA: NAD(P)-dependent oxidoreductase [Mucilaginibacter sp.]|nr:NAD(P)-dependent oxidoreductase [Mucilaginibacter sp.]
MKEKILITGASGFLGKILSYELTNIGYDLLTIGRKKTDTIYADLTDDNLHLPIEHSNIDIVIHSAGKAHSIPRTEQEAKVFLDVNFEGTKNLCRAIDLQKKLPKAFIFISSVAVYGVDKGQLIPESHQLNGSTPYAQSKILAEEWLQTWAKENGVILSILRLPLVAGYHPPGNLGAMIKGISSGRYASIGKANARKSMVWAPDIAYIVPKLAIKGGVYNLTDDYHPTFGELEYGISSLLGKKEPIRIPMNFAKGIAILGDILGNKSPINSEKLKKITSTLTFDDTKAKKLLDWRPNKVLDKLSQII